MSRRRRFTVGLIVTVVIVATVGIGGAASAFWRVSGTGSGSFATGTTVPITLSAAAAAANLYPGGSSDVTTTATNTNSAEVRLLSIALDTTQGTGGFTVTGDTPAGGCLASSLSFAASVAGWTIPANGTLAITLPNAITLAPTASSACQGATITVFLRTGP